MSSDFFKEIDMKVVLSAINAKYIHSNPAIYGLKAYAGALGDMVTLKEYTINQYTDEIFQDLYKEKADVAVFSCYIWNISMVLELADLLKKALPEIQIWLGGPEVSYDTEELMQKNPAIDGVMRGEGEVTFKQMLAHWEKSDCLKTTLKTAPEAVSETKSDLKNILGITWRMDNEIIENAPALPVDMNTLPFIYKDMSVFEHKIIYYESSRGCPYSCSYCLSSIDKRVRFKDTELVKKELQVFLDAKVPQVKFVDRTFNCRHTHTMEVWRYIHEHDNGVTNFHFEITADLLNDEELNLLAQMRPGLVQLEIGVQSTYPKTIEEIRRKVDFNKLSYVVNKIHAAGNIHQHLDLIAGLPYESLEQFKQSFDDVYHLRPHQLQLGFLKVLKGSYMYEKQKDYGLVYRTKPMYEVISTDWMSFDDILYLKDIEEVVELFYNTHQFDMSVGYLEWFYDRPFELYDALAGYFRKKGWFGVNCKRQQRYDQLLEFAKTVVPDIDLFKELLVWDLYAREAVKTRPDWANDLTPEKERIAQMYSDSVFIEQYLPDYIKESYRTIRHYTHIEPLHYDLNAAVQKGEIVHADEDMLFDYRKRNPLTDEAKTVRLNRS